MKDGENIQLEIEKIIKMKAPGFGKKIPGFAYRLLEKIICQRRINYVLRTYGHLQGVDFAKALMSYLNVTIELTGIENIPAEGRFTFASNHPLGGLDGVALVAALGDYYQGNVRVVVNDLLMNVYPLKSVFVPINKHGAQARGEANLMLDAYESDAQMIVFPAGLVSRKQPQGIEDLEWKKAFLLKTIAYQRDVIPIYFEGYNSRFFYNFSRWRTRLGIKVNLDMVLLPSELFKNSNQHFKIHIGTPISWQKFDKSQSLSDWAAWVKKQTYKLRSDDRY